MIPQLGQDHSVGRGLIFYLGWFHTLPLVRSFLVFVFCCFLNLEDSRVRFAVVCLWAQLLHGMSICDVHFSFCWRALEVFLSVFCVLGLLVVRGWGGLVLGGCSLFCFLHTLAYFVVGTPHASTTVVHTLAVLYCYSLLVCFSWCWVFRFLSHSQNYTMRKKAKMSKVDTRSLSCVSGGPLWQSDQSLLFQLSQNVTGSMGTRHEP